MSLARLVLYSALLSAYAALFGWFLAEMFFFRSGNEAGTLQVACVAGLMGAAIGLGVNLVAGMANAQWRQLVRRALPGLAGGCIGGALGGLIGDGLYAFGLPRAIGWLVMGLSIGVVEGIYERSKSKIRNGLIGGAVGGLLGGILFDPIQSLITSQSGMSSRAVAFVILGTCIGAMIGLAQVVLKDAWLTVVDGYRAGRQLILSQPVTVLGRAEHVPLPFLGPVNAELEAEHVRIVRQPGGSFLLEDNHTRVGTKLNNQPVQGRVSLNDGDVIKLGKNYVRFNERQRRSAGEPSVVVRGFHGQVTPPPPPPNVHKSRPVAQSPGSVPQARSTPSRPTTIDLASAQNSAARESPSSTTPKNVSPAKPAPNGPTAPGGPPGRIAPPPPPRRPKSV